MGTAGARKKYNCPQYDNFMGIGGGIGEPLEMLLARFLINRPAFTDSLKLVELYLLD